MGVGVGPHNINDGLVFGYDTGFGVHNEFTSTRFYKGHPAVNCAPGVVPTTGISDGAWTSTEITDGSITPPRKGARVFKLVAGSTSNLYRQSNYYGGGGFSSNNPQNALILGRTSPSNYTTTSTAGKYQYGFWVRGDESNTSSWGIGIDKGDKAVTSYTVGNNTDWYFISASDQGNNSNSYPYDFFDMFSDDSGLVIYISDFGIYRAPGTVDSLPDLPVFPNFVDYNGGTVSYTQALRDIAGDGELSVADVSYVSSENGQPSFDGTDDFINISGTSGLASDLRITGNVTIECVCKPHSQNNGNMFAMATNNGYRMRVQSNNDLWIYSNGNTVSGGNMTVNNWHHCVGVFSDTGLRLYQNNSLISSNSSAYSPATSSWGSQGAVIGGYTTTSELFDGSISVIRIYNRALTAEEVSRNYKTYKNRFNI